MINRFIISILLISMVACSSIQNAPLTLLSGKGPSYPEGLKDSGVEGHVVLRYDVSAAGEVINIRVVESEPLGVFESAARETLSSWRFSAKVVDGLAQPSQNVLSTISFRLSDGSSIEP